MCTFQSIDIISFLSHNLGEYEYRCNGCQKEIIDDLHKACNSINNERINQHDFEDNVLFGFVCVLCQYIQLKRDKLIAHLENDHQLLRTESEKNVDEIPLLKTSQSLDFLMETKFDPSLVAAKQRVSVIHQTDRYEDYEPVVLSDDENIERGDITIDLTLSDDDI